jgi:TM2 domain-containing membrane protein YozV
MFCSRCGAANKDDARFCKACSASLGAPAASAGVLMVEPARSPGLAAVLSFFICGLGQIYNGQIFKGISMIIVYGISVLLMFAIIGLITTPILWIWGMVDAYRTADRLNLAAHADFAFASQASRQSSVLFPR